MEILKQIAIGLLIAVVLFIIIGLSLPKETVVERSIIINAPVGAVFNMVNNLKNHEKWDPWQAADKTMKITYGTVTEGTGASYGWTSEMVDGTQTITESVTNRSIKVELDLKKQKTMRGWWNFTAGDKGVLVTKKIVNKAGTCFWSRYINLLTDAEIGRYFSKGLKKLKEVSEQAK
jgi:ribosome-associated toxin RatA of RatAB toxin-antitoxin module